MFQFGVAAVRLGYFVVRIFFDGVIREQRADIMDDVYESFDYCHHRNITFHTFDKRMARPNLGRDRQTDLTGRPDPLCMNL